MTVREQYAPRSFDELILAMMKCYQTERNVFGKLDPIQHILKEKDQLAKTWLMISTSTMREF